LSRIFRQCCRYGKKH